MELEVEPSTRKSHMPPGDSIAVLIILVVGAVLVLVVWGGQTARGHRTGFTASEPRSDVLVWTLALAALTLGVFFTYLVYLRYLLP